MIAGELADRARALQDARTPFVLATVVRAQHPTSVRAGDHALVLGDGSIAGFVGGLCAESTVRMHALRAMETGEPILLRIVPDDGDASGPLEGAVVEHNPCLSGGALEIFLEPQLPRARFIVTGTSPIALAVAKLAGASGYEVEREANEIASDTLAIVVASHGADEERALASALRAGVPYVALVASRVRGEVVRAALDVPDELRARLHTPAGLDIGARTPAEIAVSILAELVAEQHAQPAAAQVAAQPAAARVIESAVDPVCGMEVAASEATLHLDLAGGRVYFCGEGCRSAYASQHSDAVAG